jgi:hypothetical protein
MSHYKCCVTITGNYTTLLSDWCFCLTNKWKVVALLSSQFEKEEQAVKRKYQAEEVVKPLRDLVSHGFVRDAVTQPVVSITFIAPSPCLPLPLPLSFFSLPQPRDLVA